MEPNEFLKKKPGELAVPLDDAPVKPYSKAELCRMYNISFKTFTKWLAPFADEIGIRNGRYYNPFQVRIIFARLGLPVILVFFLLRHVINDLIKFL